MTEPSPYPGQFPPVPETDAHLPMVGAPDPDAEGQNIVGLDFQRVVETDHERLEAHLDMRLLRPEDVLVLECADPDGAPGDIKVTTVCVTRSEMPILRAGSITQESELSVPKPHIWAKISGDNMPPGVEQGDEVLLSSGTRMTSFGTTLREGINTRGYLEVLPRNADRRMGYHGRVASSWPITGFRVQRPTSGGELMEVHPNALEQRRPAGEYDEARNEILRRVSGTLKELLGDSGAESRYAGTIETDGVVFSVYAGQNQGEIVVVDKRSGRFVGIDFKLDGSNLQISLPGEGVHPQALGQVRPTGIRDTLTTIDFAGVSPLEATYTFSGKYGRLDGAVSTDLWGAQAADLGAFDDGDERGINIPACHATIYADGETVVDTYVPERDGQARRDSVATQYRLRRDGDALVQTIGGREVQLRDPQAALDEAGDLLDTFMRELSNADLLTISADVVELGDWQPVQINVPRRKDREPATQEHPHVETQERRNRARVALEKLRDRVSGRRREQG